MITQPGGSQVRLWARFMCGCCGRGFTANPDTVPMFIIAGQGRQPCCLSCWTLRNQFRQAAGLPPDGRPLAYPEDYPQEAERYG